MYYSEKITPEIIQKIVSGEDTRYYKTNGSRIVFSRACSYCGNEYWPSRSNQKFCSNSCRVLNCQKKKLNRKLGANSSSVSTHSKNDLGKLGPNINQGVNWKQVGESALGSAAVEGIKYLTHDLPVAKKIDRILQILEAKASVYTPIKKKPLSFMGLQQFSNTVLAIFKDPGNGQFYGFDGAGNWLVKQGEGWYRMR